jgi:hypothetical protein
MPPAVDTPPAPPLPLPAVPPLGLPAALPADPAVPLVLPGSLGEASEHAAAATITKPEKATPQRELTDRSIILGTDDRDDD